MHTIFSAGVLKQQIVLQILALLYALCRNGDYQNVFCRIFSKNTNQSQSFSSEEPKSIDSVIAEYNRAEAAEQDTTSRIQQNRNFRNFFRTNDFSNFKNASSLQTESTT